MVQWDKTSLFVLSAVEFQLLLKLSEEEDKFSYYRIETAVKI